MRNRVLLAGGIFAAAGLAGCAERGLPPGGPVDDVPPTVALVEPAEGATRAASGTPIRLLFSERMNRSSVERALRIFPDPGRFDRRWEGLALVVGLAPGAPEGPGGLRVVSLLRSAEDRRGNRLREPYEAAFTTGDSIPGGEIAGRLSGDSREARARLLLFRAPGPPLDSLAAAGPLRETSAAADGAFRFRFLSASGETLALFALAQAELGPRIDPERDRLAVGPDTLVLTAERPRIDGTEMSLVAPDAPGSVAGGIGAPAESARVLLRNLTDSTRVLEAVPDSSGAFLIESVPPGAYRLRLVAGAEGAEGPAPGAPDTIRVVPGARVRLPGARPAPGERGGAGADGAAGDTLGPPAAADTTRAPAAGDTGRAAAPGDSARAPRDTRVE